MADKILFITLSNIGDVILTLPVLDALRENFPGSRITCLAGPRAKEIFQDNPHIGRFIVFDKHSKLKEKIKLFKELKRENFDIIVDLRNSFFGAFLPARYKTSPFLVIPKDIKHVRDKHLYKVKGLPQGGKNSHRLQAGFRLGTEKAWREKFKIKNIEEIQTKSFYISREDERSVSEILKNSNILSDDRLIVISAGARSHIKRWSKEKFAELIPLLLEEFQAKAILAGDKDDTTINKYIAEQIPFGVLDLTGKTTLPQLGCLLKRAGLLLANDSATIHLASYLDVPTLAIFGPTNESRYGPWSKINRVAKKDIFCRPCERAQCRFNTLDCLRLIKIGDVLRQARDILNSKFKIQNSKQIQNPKPKIQNRFKRILIVRTDRIGDVLLSTPVVKALRDNYPSAYLAMMVSPYTRDIVDGNPYLDEVIIYDKEGRHKGWLAQVKFSRFLKKKGFDLAIILHPTNRVHLVTFLAGIPKRIGYDRKLGFLLTDRIKHTKERGEKNELEYSLDLVRYLNIEPEDKEPFMPIRPASEVWVEELFAQFGIKKEDKLLAIHPGASCPSKIWPQERFAQVADRLAQKYGFKVLVIASAKDIAIANALAASIQAQVINLGGKTSVSQLASLLKRCQLFISNDSGPVHIASSLEVPVISIFGRSQKGLSPRRWGPVGKKSRILHKEVGCIQCLAHNCVKEFACLKAISVDDVIAAADSLLAGEYRHYYS